MDSKSIAEDSREGDGNRREEQQNCFGKRGGWRLNDMLHKGSKIHKDSPTQTNVVSSRQTPCSVAGVSPTAALARSENPTGGRGESMLGPCGPEKERDYQVAYESLNLEKIEQRGLSILHASSSGYAEKRKHDDMTRHKSPQEENFSAKRSRSNRSQREKRDVVHEKDENIGAADQSDSTIKVSSGDSDLTAERMAEASSRTTSSSDNNNGCTLNTPPLSTTDASAAAVNQLSFIATDNFQITSSDSGLHKSNIEDGQTVYRSEGFSLSSSILVSEKEQDWLALGLSCGSGNHQPKHVSNEPHLDKTNNLDTSMNAWNGGKNKDDHGQLPQQMFNAGLTSNLTTLLAQSSSTIPCQQFSFQSTTNSMPRPLHQATNFRIQKNSRESSNFSALNLLQPCTIEDQQRSQNITLFPSAEQMNFNFQRQPNGATPWQSKEAAKWQAFYDRISQAIKPPSNDLGVSEPRIAASLQGRHRFSPGWKSFTTGSAATPSYQNAESDGPAYYANLQDAGVLQMAVIEKMQCRAQWNARDNFSSSCQPEISLGSMIRPSVSEIAARNSYPTKRILSYGQQQYEVHAPPLEESMPPGPFRELQKISDPSLTENVRIFRPPRTAQIGVWFALKPLNEQNGDRMLPQIQKNYLRIKDGTMTILVVKKYLVNKLGLNSESEIEIMCRGEQLVASVTLQHVRDVMWMKRQHQHPHPSSNHFMVLHYQRSRL